MKKHVFHSISAFLLLAVLATTSNAQIKVESSKVGISGGYTTNEIHAQYGTLIKGYTPGVYVQVGSPGIVFTHRDASGGYESILSPYSNNGGYLGTSDKKWFQINAGSCYLSTLYVAGNPITGSDERFKKNIVKLQNATDIVKKMEGVKYDKILDTNPNDSITIPDVKEYGFIAQDLQSIIPDVVAYDKERDIYGVSYQSIIPILVEAFKAADHY